MRYIGSKTASLAAIEQAVSKWDRLGLKHLCDPFAGICTVSQHFKKLGYRITTGDILAQSYAFQLCNISSNRRPSFQKLIGAMDAHEENVPGHLTVLKHLNQIPGIEDYISHHYSTLGNERRKFFTRSNAKKIDAIRTKIAEWKTSGLLSMKEEAYLIVSLLHAADRVANTAGTYYAYLKEFNRKSSKHLCLSPVHIYNNGSDANEVYKCDARSLVQQITPDILYLDPPYNERDYGAYYHLTESLVLWDKKLPTGRSGIPQDRAPKSVFCKPHESVDALDDLIRDSKARIIMLHYAVDGLVSHSQILEMLSEKGITTFQNWRVRRYRANSSAPATCSNRLYVCQSRHK